MSNLSALTHEEKQFHKLMAQEAKADDMLIKIAEKEVKRAEKAYNKSVKETEKAERDAAKAADAKAKTAKKLNKVEHTHKDAVVHCEQAEKKFEEKSQYQNIEIQDVQQRQSQLFEVHRTYGANERERAERMSALRNGADQGGGGMEAASA